METSNQIGESYFSIVKKQFKKNKRAVWSLRIVFFLFFIALLSDFIANEKPIIAKLDGKIYFPVMQQYAVNLKLSKWPKELRNINWLNKEFDWAMRPLIPYSPTTQDFKNAQYTGPFEKQNIPSWRWRHWLGTEKLGRDVLSGLIHGTRIAFMVGIVSMSLATIIGLFLGSIAGYFGDYDLRVSRGSLLLATISVFVAMYYGFFIRGFYISEGFSYSFSKGLVQVLFSLSIMVTIFALGWLLSKGLNMFSFFNKKSAIPTDIVISRLMEVLVSIPKLFLIIAIVAVAKPSIYLVMAIIGLTSWTGIARFIRAELLKIKQLEYIEAAKSLGYSPFKILRKHAIPNALSPVLITIAFGIAAAILIEAFLSFIGIGIPPEVLTWGKLLSFARAAPTAWWLAVFPGMAIFITVTLLNLIGEGLTDALDPKLRK